MNITTTRKAAAGFFALAALGLAACSPPHEVDSGNKVDTATSQNPDSLAGSGHETPASATRANVVEASQANATPTPSQLPTYINCGTDVGPEPDRLVLSCEDEDDYIENITWNEWSGRIGSGLGTRVTLNPDRRVEGTQVVLGNPEVIDGVLRFTTVSVDGISINPESNY
ncbi:hypothetical protein ACUY28_08600 [Corynebacterium sanguinis]|uniref:Lipoprotein n=1 Tax=Corynebacterium sanguinis TaxID=2594913 RepID=A0A6I7R563_9CORY|nr:MULTISPECIES: hypothetical protein [Corynebacterium]MBA4503919.1 hypothetical protein [Corynebacterium sanguinis]MCT1412389.1 hypothetical protein [Corynebacterium sanguinis]MCT1426503.1 hypothetical protein [Corynebacterium sanguinis]MCT1463775.1 hypothetical protein [Corynebacterium sanguinis]MCT1491964.1 hypothetical protein [Corynebacterium sanguinis]